MTRPGSILLVEDTRSDALLYAALLRAGDPARQVDHAPTLEAALAMLDRGGYAAVLLDLGLPDSQELEGLQLIVAHHPDLAVVVLTGREDDGLGERAIAAGAQEYLRKGEAKGEVIERVLRHAQGRKAMENRVREAAVELHVLFDRNPMPVFVFDEASLRMRAANAAALEFYGWEHDEFLQRTALDIRPPHEHGRLVHGERPQPVDGAEDGQEGSGRPQVQQLRVGRELAHAGGTGHAVQLGQHLGELADGRLALPGVEHGPPAGQAGARSPLGDQVVEPGLVARIGRDGVEHAVAVVDGDETVVAQECARILGE